MTISKVQIANMALSNLGTRSKIQNFTEGSREAESAGLWYDQSRLLTLEGYNWSFAKRRVALALASESAPEGIWAYRYLYPANCLKARFLEQPDYLTTTLRQDVFQVQEPDPDAIPFEIEMEANEETKTILTDLEDAILVYTFDQINSDLFSRFFVQTLSYALAFNMAIDITGRKSIKDDMLIQFSSMMRMASAHDANERVAKPPRESEMIRMRY